MTAPKYAIKPLVISRLASKLLFQGLITVIGLFPLVLSTSFCRRLSWKVASGLERRMCALQVKKKLTLFFTALRQKTSENIAGKGEIACFLSLNRQIL